MRGVPYGHNTAFFDSEFHVPFGGPCLNCLYFGFQFISSVCDTKTMSSVNIRPCKFRAQLGMWIGGELSLLMSSKMSLIKMLNRSADRGHPCRTPCRWLSVLEAEVCTLTLSLAVS